ncbi:MAG: hypothetical protein LBP59_03720 [Planctomycetaceae bacterium]|nr:hypothetical protein [Planctomycetaceae bacterium]
MLSLAGQIFIVTKIVLLLPTFYLLKSFAQIYVNGYRIFFVILDLFCFV